MLLLLNEDAFDIRSLFTAGEQGIWLDPSDFSTLFQDSAGTTPVTAVGQPVGLALDKSGRGNHATQSTSASRPTVEARVNLLTYSEQLDNAAWGKGGTILPTVTPNAFVAPDGTTTMDAVVQQGGASANVSQGTIAEAATYYVDFWLLADTTTTAALGFRNTTDAAWMDVTAAILQGPGSISAHVPGAIRIISGLSTSVHTKVRLTTASPVAAGKLVNLHIYPETSSTSTVGKSIGIWGVEMRKLSDAAYPYQRVNSATDYVDVGAPRYLQFDGIDDGMATPSINFTGTDKVTAWAGVRKLSDAAIGMIVELSASAGANNGVFYLAASAFAGANYQLISKGTVLAAATPSGIAAPITKVLTGIGDISGDISSVRVNGTATSVATDQGTGNYGNYPLYIGRRGGTSLPFNGRIYQLIIRGAASNAGQIAAGEAWCNAKTRAY